MEKTAVTLDIVNLIEKNPIARFNRDYQNKFIQKIQQKFTDTEQHLFVASFYCFLNYNKNDFVIDMENVWKWLGFARKDFCKRVLDKHFIKGTDYIIALLQAEKPKNEGGHNKETILLSVLTFKKLCLKSNTKKADEIHDYFIKLEETLQEVINEESNELRLQLSNSVKEKECLREKTILDYFPDNTQCVYYGIIDNKTPTGESLIKFGNSNFLRNRIDVHKKTFANFRLINAFKVINKTQIENEMKNHSILKMMQRSLSINGQNQTELLLNNITFDDLDKIIKEIITKIEFNPENYKKIVEENEELKKEVKNLKELLKRAVVKKTIKEPPNEEPPNEEPLNEEVPEEEPLENTIEPIMRKEGGLVYIEESTIVLSDKEYNYETNRLRRLTREKDGFLHIGGTKYPKIHGTREEVWNNIAYKTTGGLFKSDLDIGREGKIVSINKRIASKLDNHLKEYAQPKLKPAI